MNLSHRPWRHASRWIATVLLLGSLAVERTGVPSARITTTTAPVATVLVADEFAPTPVLDRARVSATQMTSWYLSRSKTSSASVSVAELAQLFLTEGMIEGVAGDLAFVQSMLETSWLEFSARVPSTYNNFAGIGAVDGGSDAAQFPSAAVGVRAQIQHLRAYADASVTCTNFARPTVTPRCDLVVPKGKAPTWNQMGGGNWATDPDYDSKVLTLFEDLLAFSGQPPLANFENVWVGGHTVIVAGWALDPDGDKPLVLVIVNGLPVAQPTASRYRPDVRTFLGPEFDPNSGWAAALTLPTGTHEVCVHTADSRSPQVWLLVACRDALVK